MGEAGISTARFVHENDDITFSFAESDRNAVNRLVARLPETGAADVTLDQPGPKSETEPTVAATTKSIYPGDKNGLPFEVYRAEGKAAGGGMPAQQRFQG